MTHSSSIYIKITYGRDTESTERLKSIHVKTFKMPNLSVAEACVKKNIRFGRGWLPLSRH